MLDVNRSRLFDYHDYTAVYKGSIIGKIKDLEEAEGALRKMRGN